MKRLALLVAIVLAPSIINAQSEIIDKIIDKYSGQEGVTVVNISSELFELMNGLEINDLDKAEFPQDKLSTVKILSVENAEALSGSNFYEEVTEGINTSDFVEVMTVKDGSEDIKMWMKTKGKQIQDFLLVVSSPDEGVVVYVKGDFNVDDINGMAQQFGGLEDMDEFENMEID